MVPETRLLGDDFRATYRVGGLEFTAKSPDAVGDPNFTFESTNHAQLTFRRIVILDAQSAIIAYGHAPEEWNDSTTYAAASDKVVLGDVIYEANNIAPIRIRRWGWYLESVR